MVMARLFAGIATFLFLFVKLFNIFRFVLGGLCSHKAQGGRGVFSDGRGKTNFSLDPLELKVKYIGF